MARISTLLLFLALTVSFTEGKKGDSNENKKCPSFKNIADFSQASEIKRIQDDIMYDLWDIETPELTDLGEDFVDILFDLTQSDVPSWRRYALSVSELIWAYLPDMDRGLNLCSYAEMIDKTLAFNANNDCNSILRAVNSSTKAFTEAGLRLTENAIRNAGCKLDGISLSKAVDTVCKKNGFSYKIKEMWDELGSNYPSKLERIVKKLYNSDQKIDKIMALLATSALSKYLSILENEYDPEILYRTFAMLTPGKIPEECCKKFKKEALDLSAVVQKKNVGMFELARKSTKCPY